MYDCFFLFYDFSRLITTQKPHILDNNSHEFRTFWVVIMPNIPKQYTLLPLQEILMVFVKFWRYFKVTFEILSDKREMESRKVNNMDDEEEAMHLDQDLELNWRWLRWIQKKEMGEMTKRSWKIMFFHFAQLCEMDHKAILVAAQREN